MTTDTEIAIAADQGLANRSERQTADEVLERAVTTLDTLESLQHELRQAELETYSGDTPLAGEALDLPAGFQLSIVVPVYNERLTIKRVISSLYALPIPVEVIVVDDGSNDGTCAALIQLNQEFPELRIAFQEENQGKGAALRRGFALASGSHVVVQDADLEYDPREIPALLEPLARDEADVVYGSRFLEQRWTGSSRLHRLGNRALTAASNWATGWNLTDMETCYKVFRRDLLDDIQLEQDRFGFEVELTSKLAKLGARVMERPISYAARGWEEGKKIGWRDGLQALYCIFRYR